MRNAIESLEPRRLFVIDTVVWATPPQPPPASPTDFSGTSRNDVIVVFAATDGSGDVTVSINGRLTDTDSGELRISGHGGNDKIHVDLPDSYAHWLITVYGGAGDDVIVGSLAAERIIAGDGNDYLNGNGGRDTIYAEAGDDSVRGGGSSDLLDGGEGADTVRGDAGNDRMNGGGGIDRLRGSLGDDSIAGGASKDFIGGEIGNDSLSGDGGNDVLSGGEGSDTLVGGAGTDHCSGDAGDDNMGGGSGVDSLFGGAGRDGWATWIDANEGADTADDIVPGGTDGTNDNRLNVDGRLQAVVQYNYSPGTGVTTSAPSATGGSGATVIGVATGQQSAGGGTFGGQTVGGVDTVVMYTYAGDANLDGLIDVNDYGVIDFNTLPDDAYFNGDFNYDGVINADDYGTIDFNILTQGASSPVSP